MKNPGNRRVRYPTTVTPSVSRRSSVAGTSRIDFTPAQTTAIRVRGQSVTRSADSSKVRAASRCTPPSPPVANTPMPAAAAIALVLATVVAPSTPAAAATGRSRTDSLATPSPVASRVNCASSSPTTIWPPIMPIVAGTAPLSRTTCFDLAGHREIVRPGQAVRDDRALQGDDRGTGGQSGGDLGTVPDRGTVRHDLS